MENRTLNFQSRGLELMSVAGRYAQRGKPMQNGFIERCNGNIRRELLNAYVFKTLNEVREKTEEWMDDYNNNRPHAALNYKTPMEILENV